MRDRSDEQLMANYAAGEIGAFDELYGRHRAPMYRFILRQVGDAVVAIDLYQGCWEKMIKARHTYRKSVPFRAWMYRIARNHLVDHYRRSPPPAEACVGELAEASAGPEEHLSRSEGAARLASAIRQLPVEQRETLMLKLEGGLDLKAIADITGVNPETAKSRLRYAVSKLKLLLQGGEFQPGGPA